MTPAVTDNNGATTIDDVVPGSEAHFMWHPSDAIDVYFRYKFTLKPGRHTLPMLAQAFLDADDCFELWINGNFVTAGCLDVSSPVWSPPIVDMTSYLQAGDNVIAIRAIDGDCIQRDPGTSKCLRIPDNLSAFSRVFRAMFFDGVVELLESQPKGREHR